MMFALILIMSIYAGTHMETVGYYASLEECKNAGDHAKANGDFEPPYTGIPGLTYTCVPVQRGMQAK
jgi:hypothetical protein